jgi:hypothetical protein
VSRFDLIGAKDATPSLPANDPVKGPSRVDAWVATAATLAGGAVGMALWSYFPRAGKKHPVLGLLDGLAVGGNLARVATGEIAPRRAIENLGAHAVATASSLALPAYPAIGYVAGAAGANLFFRNRGDTYLERLDETVLGGARRAIPAEGSS